MNDEQLRAEFEAWAARIGLCVTGKYAETINGLCAESAFKAGYKAALQSKGREDEHCVWHNDPETDNSWETDCRQLFEIYEGTPSDNRMAFCCYCGKPIREAIDHARRVEGGGE